MALQYVAWGLVARVREGRQELLVATRTKKDDLLRHGQMVLPGGGRLVGHENYAQAAAREVYEETGIRTAFSPTLDFIPKPRNFGKPNLTGHVDGYGAIHLTYLDSGKTYCGRIISLFLLGLGQEPTEQEGPDARNPRYIAVQEAFGSKDQFTPACQALLEIIEYDLILNPHALNS